MDKKSHPSAEVCSASLAAVGDAMYAIGGKWKLKIIVAMIDHRRRFNELQRLVEGISAKVLSNELKELELNGFVRKIPVAGSHLMEYELTDYSDTLGDVLHSLTVWGAMHRKKITGRSLKLPALETTSVD
ncbi:winged helix-turn-helix transcriptional regulator [Chitinophaga sp. RCC_12]|uniref:winged helix-turn-helix transcriptional regulator n=1 Tax=Chitinophaga sp. RCC_12 TaxID=3239226 RepID=UPI0035241170